MFKYVLPITPKETTPEPNTILKTIEEAADKLMATLESNDCDEVVCVHISRNTGLINLAHNKEVYALRSGEWKLI